MRRGNDKAAKQTKYVPPKSNVPLIVDAGKGLRKGAKEVLPFVNFLSCYFHFKQAVRTNKFKCLATYPNILEVLNLLHYCTNETELTMGWQLAMETFR